MKVFQPGMTGWDSSSPPLSIAGMKISDEFQPGMKFSHVMNPLNGYECTLLLEGHRFKKMLIFSADPSSSYMESACYIINAIYAAEVSNDKEILCTLYATAVVHMREKLWSWIGPFPEV